MTRTRPRVAALLILGAALACGVWWSRASSRPVSRTVTGTAETAPAAPPAADEPAAREAPVRPAPAKPSRRQAAAAVRALLAARSVRPREPYFPPLTNGPAPRLYEVDPVDPRARLLLLSPGGPLLIEVEVTLDGRPFQALREELIAESLAEYDRNHNGQVKWSEAIQSPRLLLGRFHHVSERKTLLAQMHERFDLDRDAYVDPFELRWALADQAGGPALSVAAQAGPEAEPDLVWSVLDQDASGALEAEEIAAAPGRLKRWDRDDSDLLEAAELASRLSPAAPAAPERGAAAPPARTPGSFLVPLHGQNHPGELLSSLYRRYGVKWASATEFRLAPSLFGELDADGDGVLQALEMEGLLTAAPQAVLTVDLGAADERAVLGLRAAAEEAASTAPPGKSAGPLSLEWPGLRLTWRAGSPPRRSSFGDSGAGVVKHLDLDGNNYVDAAEFAAAPGFADRFQLWDENGDGLVYAEEINRTSLWQEAADEGRVSVALLEVGDPLWALLDVDEDGRLRLRELRGSSRRLAAADRNGDGRLLRGEPPAVIRLAVGRGGSAPSLLTPPDATDARAVWCAEEALPLPEWFRRMDRNRDGDVSEREFLGDADQFQALDADGDKLVDAAEAEAQTQDP